MLQACFSKKSPAQSRRHFLSARRGSLLFSGGKGDKHVRCKKLWCRTWKCLHEYLPDGRFRFARLFVYHKYLNATSKGTMRAICFGATAKRLEGAMIPGKVCIIWIIINDHHLIIWRMITITNLLRFMPFLAQKFGIASFDSMRERRLPFEKTPISRCSRNFSPRSETLPRKWLHGWNPLALIHGTTRAPSARKAVRRFVKTISTLDILLISFVCSVSWTNSNSIYSM